MIDNETKKSILAKILQSEEFKTSKICSKLLTYLVEASISNKELKEYTIASEVFCKNSDFNYNEDPIVRVSIHNLRIKLHQYYQREGKQAKIRIDIPKGHYEVQFINQTKDKIIGMLVNSKTVLYFIVGILFSMLIFTLFQNLSLRQQIHRDYKLNKNNAIWSNILSSSHPKLIVLGDHFFFVDSLRDQNEKIIIRIETINSDAEFEKYKSLSSKINLHKLRYPLFAMNSIWPLPEIVNILDASGIRFSMKYASIVNSIDLKTYDIIFIGSFPTLALLNQAFKNSKFRYELKPINKLMVSSAIEDSSITYIRKGTPDSEHTDYCLVRKLPGPNNNTIFMFISFHATGTAGAVNYMTNKKTLEELENILSDKFVNVPPYFDIIFKSTGYARVVFSTEIEFVNKTNPDLINW